MQAKPSSARAQGPAVSTATPSSREDALMRQGIDLDRIEDAHQHVAEVVVTYCGTIVDASHVGQHEDSSSFTIGEGPTADFPMSGDGLPDPAASPLVLSDPHGVVIVFSAQMSGRVRVGNQWLTLDELVSSRRAVADGNAFRYPMPAGSIARLHRGDVTFHVRAVPKGRRVAGRGKIDRQLWGFVGGTGLASAALFSLLSMIPSDVLAFELEDDVAGSRFASFHHIADEKLEEPDDVESGDDQPKGGQGQRADGTEGEMGKPSSKKPKGVYKMRGPANSIPQLARNIDPTLMAQQAGILGLMQKEQGHFFASVHGGAFAVGQDDEDIWGGLEGSEYGEAHGTIGGLGLLGTGHGGGGTGEGTIGMGNTGLIGKGAAGGDGVGYGRGSGLGFGKKVKHPPTVKAKPIAQLQGPLDKSIIRRVVRAHINEVRACYNQGLVRNPSLRGRVAIQFTIGGTGVVTNAVVGESSLSDPQVGRCVAKAVKRWRFPKPPGGGMVLVTYPFAMDPAT